MARRAAGAGLEGLYGAGCAGAEDCVGDDVGPVEYCWWVSPGSGEFFFGRWCAGGEVWEVPGKSGEVGGGGAAPTVDGLHGVAHGCDAQFGVDAAEEAAQEQPLGVAGVLVFIQHDHAVAFALAGSDARVRHD